MLILRIENNFSGHHSVFSQFNVTEPETPYWTLIGVNHDFDGENLEDFRWNGELISNSRDRKVVLLVEESRDEEISSSYPQAQYISKVKSVTVRGWDDPDSSKKIHFVGKDLGLFLEIVCDKGQLHTPQYEESYQLLSPLIKGSDFLKGFAHPSLLKEYDFDQFCEELIRSWSEELYRLFHEFIERRQASLIASLEEEESGHIYLTAGKKHLINDGKCDFANYEKVMNTFYRSIETTERPTAILEVHS